eukprot:7771919-Pyramimonas_sp.AAC.1
MGPSGSLKSASHWGLFWGSIWAARRHVGSFLARYSATLGRFGGHIGPFWALQLFARLSVHIDQRKKGLLWKKKCGVGRPAVAQSAGVIILLTLLPRLWRGRMLWMGWGVQTAGSSRRAARSGASCIQRPVG